MFPTHRPGDEFQSETFKNIRASASLFEDIRFNDCTFTKCFLSESVFRKCRFTSCLFKSCTLDLIRIPGCSFNGVRFDKTHCAGVDWTEAHWERKPWLGAIDFTSCSVNHNTFIGLNLPHLTLNSCTALEANFEDADLSGADLRNTDFSGARFNHTNLSEADLSAATHYLIPPQHNTLKKTRFSLPDALGLLYALDIELVDPQEQEEEKTEDEPDERFV